VDATATSDDDAVIACKVQLSVALSTQQSWWLVRHRVERWTQFVVDQLVVGSPGQWRRCGVLIYTELRLDELSHRDVCQLTASDCYLVVITHAGIAAGVGRRSDASVCVSVCLRSNKKTASAINTKLGTRILHSSRSACIDLVVKRSKVKVTQLQKLSPWHCLFVRVHALTQKSQGHKSRSFVRSFVLCGQESSLLWTSVLRPLYRSNTPAQGQEGNW